MRPIGGYLELELPLRQEFHSGLIPLNSARNALVYVIRARGIRRIRMPYLDCPVVEDAVRRFCPGTEIEKYHVDGQWRPILDGTSADAPLYVINYFGMQEEVLRDLEGCPLVVDQAQAFFAPPPAGADAIYCPRKFVGVSDGAYLKTDRLLVEPLEQDESWPHAGFLLKRIDAGPAAGYREFKDADSGLVGRPLRSMSALTRRILQSLDTGTIIRRRRQNFKALHRALGAVNSLGDAVARAILDPVFVPFFYPLLVPDAARVRSGLIAQDIFVPVFWPELLMDKALNPFERQFVDSIVCLPVDQRYRPDDMRYMAGRVKGLLG